MAARGAERAAGRRGEAPRYPVPALDKGLDILETLAGEPDGLTQSQIARRLGRSVSEIFRMIAGLERRRYIGLLQPGDRYGLTLRLFELGHRHPPMRRLLAKALPRLEAVAAATRQSCHLVVLHEARILVVAQVDSPDRLGGYSVRLGATDDPFRASSGFVILAFQGAGRLREILAAHAAHGGRRPPRDLAAHLARIREAGYEETPSYRARGITNLSFPVFDATGTAIAALTVPFMEEVGGRIRVGHARRALRAASQLLSAELGADLAR